MFRTCLRLAGIDRFDERTASDTFGKVDKPTVFANKILSQMIDHSFGPDLAREPSDLQVIRSLFRKQGGSWEKLMRGDDSQHSLLGSIVVAWGKTKTKG
jgi:hypothetical protein